MAASNSAKRVKAFSASRRFSLTENASEPSRESLARTVSRSSASTTTLTAAWFQAAARTNASAPAAHGSRRARCCLADSPACRLGAGSGASTASTRSRSSRAASAASPTATCGTLAATSAAASAGELSTATRMPPACSCAAVSTSAGAAGGPQSTASGDGAMTRRCSSELEGGFSTDRPLAVLLRDLPC